MARSKSASSMSLSGMPKPEPIRKLKGKKPQSSLGAPSQHNQTSRKGKKAWRKNVDIEDVEQGLEGLRGEERVYGTILQKQTDDQLFAVDVKGDEQIRKTLPRFSASQLTSTKILAQRSAVPAVYSRPTTSTKRKAGARLTHEEKSRLLRIGKRLRKGPLNSYIDPTEFAAGSAMLEVSEAVKSSGSYDAWAEEEEQEELKEGMETVMEPKYKAPVFTHPKDVIEIPAIVEPHQGTSYNPPASAHQELLLQAHLIEETRLKEAQKLEEIKAKFAAAGDGVAEDKEGVPPGMTVAPVVDDEEMEVDAEEGTREPKKQPERKTKSQRNKAAKQLAEKRLLAEKAAKKRMAVTINTVKMLRRTADQTLSAREEAHALRRLVLQEKLKRGMVGQKLGKHKVPVGEVDVQLGEDLSESLRALKPEGNLFRDRFLSLQQRALIEPRVPVLPKKRRGVMKEYEKHAWKRFE